MKTAKKLTALLLVLTLLFALSATAFADTTGTVNVKFLVPMSYTLPGATTPTTFPQPTGYSVSTAFPGYYEYTANNLNLSTVASFDEGNDLNVFDVIYETAVNIKGESDAELADATSSTLFVYHYDANPAYNTSPGYVIDRLSGLETDTLVSTGNTWAGFYWSVYGVPAGVTYDVTHPIYNAATYSNLYQLGSYTSNVEAETGYTYYMVYEYSAMSW
jgi:hypothetical protein